jgi:ATP-dependent RNA helicase DbpA
MSVFERLIQPLQLTLQELGFSQPTPVQHQSIPALLEGRDLLGQAQTGSGKTAAFALPILSKLNIEDRRIQALILCPTRELCAQVAREIRKLGRKLPGLHVLVIAGGEAAKPQREALDRGVHIVVATPGRLLDLGQRGDVEIDELQTLVLDEADRMLDMGFERDIRAIIESTPNTRQTVFFSATYPETIVHMSRKYQQKPVQVKIESEETSTIDHFVVHAESEEKPNLLQKIVRVNSGSILIFANLKASINDMTEKLKLQGLPAASLHGDLEQRDRDRVLAMFRNQSVRILVASDVASRGLDIQGVDLVVHYDVPHEASVYIHRSGRTGRAGKTGVSVALGTVNERARLREFEFEHQIEIKKTQVHELNAKKEDSDGSSPSMRTLYISGGRKDKLRPGDILGALTGESGGLQAAQIGKIEIHDNFAYVAVDARAAGKAESKLRSGKIKGRRFAARLIEAVRTP